MTRLFAGLIAGTALAGTALAGAPQMDAQRGSVRSLTFEAAEAPRYDGSAEKAARSFLSEYRTLFNGGDRIAARGFAAGDTADAGLRTDEGESPEVRVTRVDETETVRFVRFQQQVEGLDVDGADVVVAVRQDGSISSVQGGYAASGHEPAIRGFASPVGIASAEAMDIAKQALAAEELAGYEASELVWWVDGDGGLVKAHRVDISATKPRGDWRYFVDAADGRILEKSNEMLFFGHEGHEATGTGKIYMTNPLRDDNLVEVTLERLQSNTKLVGQFVKVKNGKANEIQVENGDFTVEKTSTHFAEVMAYFHIDAIHQNLNEIDPAFTGMDWQIPITVHDKGSFFMKNDNAFYSPFKKAMFILDPKKLNDLHLEAGVAYHEYHHAVTDNIVPGLNSTEGRAMHEGYSDYFSCALTNDPELGEWALKPLNRPNMRDLRSQRKYPEDLHPNREPHSDGEIWGASCWDLRAAIPADKADFLVHRSRFYLSGNATFKSAYEGMLQADQDFFNGEYAEQITAVFTARGIAGETVADDGRAEDGAAVQAFEALHAE